MAARIEDQIVAKEADTEIIVDQVERKKPYQPYLDAELGLRNHWYAALFGSELLDGECRGEMVLGERLLFKRAGGKPYAIADRCPHRGAAFSARPECYTENTITCWLHGFTFDVRDGKLVQILTDPDSTHIGRLTHKTYPVEEKNGVIFVFIGDMDPPPPVEQDLQPKFLNKKLAFHPVARTKARGNWRIAVENGFDASHIYGHRNAGLFKLADAAIPLSTYPSRKELVEIIEGEEGPWGLIKLDDVNIWSADIEGKTVTSANVDPENLPSNMEIVVGVHLPCGLEVDWFPVPGMMHFEWYTPIDEDHHYYIIGHAKLVNSPEEEATFHQECEQIYGPLVWRGPEGQSEPEGDGERWGFNNFDAFGRAQLHHAYQYEDFWRKEQLYRPDYIIVRWRMLVSKHMRGIQQRGDWAPTRGWSPDGRDYNPAKHK